jgi:Ca2+-binding RTX toxin-like protein
LTEAALNASIFATLQQIELCIHGLNIGYFHYREVKMEKNHTGRSEKGRRKHMRLLVGLLLCTGLLLAWPSSAVAKDQGKPWHSDIENIRGTKGDDDDLAAHDQLNTQVRAFSGDDTIDLTEAGVQNYVDAGSGNDYVKDSPFYDTIRLGDGDDVATHTGGNDMTVGDRGNDLFEIYVDQALSPPDPPYDPGGPFVTRIDGGNDIDTARFIMTQEQVEEGYQDAITQAFETWRQTDPDGELDLNVATGSLSQPLNIILVSVEFLEILNSG